MAVTHNTTVRTDIANFVMGNSTSFVSGTNMKLKLYTGTPPANAAAGLSGNTAASTLTLIQWGAAVSGVATISGSSADASAVGGVVTFFRLYRTAASDPTDVICQGTVGTSGTDLIINNTTIAAGANVSLTGTNTYTAPN